jgi:hypothetical protein
VCLKYAFVLHIIAVKTCVSLVDGLPRRLELSYKVLVGISNELGYGTQYRLDVGANNIMTKPPLKQYVALHRIQFSTSVALFYHLYWVIAVSPFGNG